MSSPDDPPRNRPAPTAIADHYKVSMHSDDTVCVVTCKYCLRQFHPYDRSGRLNWLGAMTHTMKHVNETLRKAHV